MTGRLSNVEVRSKSIARIVGYAHRGVEIGVASAGLTTEVQPAARAGATLRVIMARENPRRDGRRYADRLLDRHQALVEEGMGKLLFRRRDSDHAGRD